MNNKFFQIEKTIAEHDAKIDSVSYTHLKLMGLPVTQSVFATFWGTCQKVAYSKIFSLPLIQKNGESISLKVYRLCSLFITLHCVISEAIKAYMKIIEILFRSQTKDVYKRQVQDRPASRHANSKELCLCLIAGRHDEVYLHSPANSHHKYPLLPS